MTDEKERIRRSWLSNAEAWTEAVRGKRIESRRVATDEAIVAAILDCRPATVLDLGCGEGWLTRALTARGVNVTGVDASPLLIESARTLAGGSFSVLSYEDIVANPDLLPAGLDVIAANFSLFEEKLEPLLIALRTRLRDGGALVIQTVHPAFLAGEAPYVDGWRTEDFESIPGTWREPMPWYFRTLSSWISVFGRTGWKVDEIREPLHPETLRPVSLIMVFRVR